jgi:tetratricopeptide (TPR) repeat protein
VIDVTRRFAAALALHRAGQFDEARQGYQAILSAQPTHVQSLRQLGLLLLQQGQLELGIASLGDALAHDDAQPLIHAHLGDAQQMLHRYQEALVSYDRALVYQPAFARVLYKRGNALQALRRHQDAVQSYGRALALKPNAVACLFNRGNALRDLGLHQQSLADYDRAIELSPLDWRVHANRGAALHALDMSQDAVLSYDRAIRLNPDDVLSHSNLGNALRALNRHTNAVRSCQRAISLQPDFAQAHWNLSLALLALGEFELGWRAYEWRWRGGPMAGQVRKFSQPLWLGTESLPGKTLLAYAEQGLGDTLQMCRYVPRLVALGARVVLEAPAPLVKLLTTLDCAVELVARGHALPEFDMQCPLMSLPLACGTTLQTIPHAVPYLRADPATVDEWHRRLGRATKPRIGLAWSGSTTHTNDRHRSMPLAVLHRIVTPDFDWHSLQKEVRASDQAALTAGTIVNHAAHLTDLAQTAALISLMDLVITVDTAVAHLAGALGKRVWLLLPFAADFRWLVSRSDSPWYPSARLFRQNTSGDWPTVVRAVAAALHGLRTDHGPQANLAP